MSARDPARAHRVEPVIDDQLEADLLDLRQHIAERRVRMFRDFTARRVRLASPLLIGACRPGELDDAAWRLAPNPRWPLHQVTSYTVRGWASRSSRRGPYLVQRPGSAGASADRLVLRITDRAAHMVLAHDQASVRTDDDGGHLLVCGEMSERDRQGLIGCPLDRVFPHPAVEEQPYIIQRTALDEARHRTLIRFAAAPVEWRMPWARPWERYR